MISKGAHMSNSGCQQYKGGKYFRNRNDTASREVKWRSRGSVCIMLSPTQRGRDN